MTYPPDVKERLLKDQNGKCIACGKPITDLESAHIHHGVIPKSGTLYKKFKKQLDMIENLFLIHSECDIEHGFLTGFFNRNCLYSKKIDWGYAMEAWLDSIPTRVEKDHFYYMKPGKRNVLLLAQIGDKRKEKK